MPAAINEHTRVAYLYLKEEEVPESVDEDFIFFCLRMTENVLKIVGWVSGTCANNDGLDLSTTFRTVATYFAPDARLQGYGDIRLPFDLQDELTGVLLNTIAPDAEIRINDNLTLVALNDDIARDIDDVIEWLQLAREAYRKAVQPVRFQRHPRLMHV